MKTPVALFLTSLFVLAVSGCATNTVTLTEKPGNIDPNAPANEKHRPGVMRYLHGGLAPSVQKEQKQKAEKRMRETCAGDYMVAEEGLDLIQDNPSSDRYWYIRFTCGSASKEN